MRVTDEMVGAALAAYYPSLAALCPTMLDDEMRGAMRAALEAALAAAPQDEPSECPHGLFDLCCNSVSDCALDRPRQPAPDALREAARLALEELEAHEAYEPDPRGRRKPIDALREALGDDK